MGITYSPSEPLINLLEHGVDSHTHSINSRPARGRSIIPKLNFFFYKKSINELKSFNYKKIDFLT